jgi:hypothetical protein
MATTNTFSIGATSFAAMSSSSGRKCVAIRVGAPKHDVRRFHCVGVDGNFVARLGRTGRRIVCYGRYVGSLSDVIGYMATDFEAWANTAQTITSEAGTTYAGCNLVPGGFERVTDPVGFKSGANTYCFVDVVITFEQDG